MTNHYKKYVGIIWIVCLILANSILVAQTLTKENEVYYSVSVVGSVKSPGVYYLLPTSRVSEAFRKANLIQDSLFASVESIPSNASMRNIILKRGSDTLIVDLQQFFTYGDEKNNPYILDGDIIIVPPIENRVSIYGAVNRGGTYELVDGDRISDIIELAMGLCNNAFLDKAEIVRFKNNHSDTELLIVDLNRVINNPDSQNNILLKNDDRIFIRSIPEFHQKRSVSVNGEVKFPGTYSIEEGKTTLYNILEEAGGFTEKADLQNAFLQRKSREDIIDPEFERLKNMLVEDMTDLEYEYFKTKSRELRGRFVTDFEKLWFEKDDDYNFLLKSGDYIYIPDKTVTVTVSGQIKNPGLVTYMKGMNYLYYIGKAGGFAWRARKGKIRVIRATTGEWLKPDENTTIEVGDMIFIPEKQEVEFWKLFKDIMRVSAEIATILIVIQNVK